ncbi:MAG TPA: DUF5372 family protein [Alphaproteobacteria bacterium]|nr:DUF5372 family protein [Alphaproteobacteria bacterium]
MTARHHPLSGQLVRVVRRLRRDGGTELVVDVAAGQRQLMPLAWTEAARAEAPAKLAATFTPGSLRALSRLIQAYRSPPFAEARHASRPDPDLVEHPAAGGAEPDGRAVGRPALAPSADPEGDAS